MPLKHPSFSVQADAPADPVASPLEDALREVALASARGELDEAGVAALVARRVRELLSSVTAAVIRNDPECLTTTGYAGPTPYPERLPKDETSSSLQAVLTGRPARVDSYDETGRPVGSFIAAQGLTCGMSVPVVIDKELWGCITVTTRRTGGFTAEEQQWLTWIAEFVSAALANAHAQARLREEARLERALREVAAASASGEVDERSLAKLVAERVAHLLNAPSAALARFDPGHLTLLGTAGPAPLPTDLPFDVPSVARLVAERGETVVIDDYAELGGPYSELAEQYGGRGAVVVPVFLGNRLWGSLGAMSPRDGFGIGAIELLERFAQLSAAALANTEAQAWLRLSEQRYRMVTSVSTDGISDLDIRTGAMWWSPQLLEKLGYSEDMFAGTYDWVLEHVVHPGDRRRLAAMLVGGEDHPTTLLRMRDATGTYHRMVMRSALERDENRNVVRRVSTFTDVTEREAAEAKRVALARELHESVIDNLVSTRARLAAVKTIGRHDPDALERALDALDVNLEVAEDSMRLVSRALRSDTTLLEPRGSLSALTETLADELRRRDPRLRVVVHDSLSGRLEAGSTATAAYAHVLREALLNVLQHADATQVTISTADDDRRIRLEVCDDGTGFDPGGSAGARLRARMQGRARTAGGVFTLHSARRQGTRIVLELPEPALTPPSNASLDGPRDAS